MLRQRADVEVVGLVTTINAAFDRVAMHGVRRTLAEAQAEAAGLPLHLLAIPYPCPNAEYERIMGAFVARQAAEGIEAMAFGDLFLEDIRRYRETKLAGTGITPLFPLWGIETGAARPQHDRRRARGLRHLRRSAPSCLHASPAGASMPRCWRTCPPGVDPCAENGEFHSFASAGPMFRSPIAVEIGETVTRDGFVFCDLIPVDSCEVPSPLWGRRRLAASKTRLRHDGPDEGAFTEPRSPPHQSAE